VLRNRTFFSLAEARAAVRELLDKLNDRPFNKISGTRSATALFDDLAIAKADGRYKRVMTALANKSLLILDDFGLEKLNTESRRDLLEIMESRYGNSSTIVASQFELKLWHDIIGDPTLADAILDRMVHNGHEVKVKGKSLRDPSTDTN
jgi:DNA replication protein DnaC